MIPDFQAMALKETEKELQELSDMLLKDAKVAHPIAQTAALIGVGLASFKSLIHAGYLLPGPEAAKFESLNQRMVQELITAYVQYRTGEMIRNYNEGNSSHD